MVLSWFNDFDITMIAIAADIMKENIPEPKLSYINSILKSGKSQISRHLPTLNVSRLNLKNKG